MDRSAHHKSVFPSVILPFLRMAYIKSVSLSVILPFLRMAQFKKGHIVKSVRCIERNFWMNTSRDIIETVTVAGIYDLRRLQIKRCGRLGPRAVLALDCCPVVTRNVHMELF